MEAEQGGPDSIKKGIEECTKWILDVIEMQGLPRPPAGASMDGVDHFLVEPSVRRLVAYPSPQNATVTMIATPGMAQMYQELTRAAPLAAELPSVRRWVEQAARG